MVPNLFAADDQAASVTNLAEMSFEQLVHVQVASVYGASKYEQKVTQAPASVSIITADEIKKFGYRTLADVLRSVRGFYVSNDRNYSYLGIRGFLRPGDYGYPGAEEHLQDVIQQDGRSFRVKVTYHF